MRARKPPEPSKPAKEPVATIAGQPIYEDELQSAVTPKLSQLRNQEYQIKKQALENLIDQKLLEAEAKKKGVSTDKFLEQEVDAKVADPTDAELNAFYLAQKNQLNRPFDDVKAQLKTSLEAGPIQQAPGFLCAAAQTVSSRRFASGAEGGSVV